MYLLIGLLTIATVSLTQVNAIPSTEETKGYILPSGSMDSLLKMIIRTGYIC